MNPIRRGVVRASAVLLAVLALAAFAPPRAVADDAAPARIRVVTDATGSRLQVNDRDFMIRGMNWDYIPIGQNYAFDLFSQPDDVIVAALDREMGLLKSMGVNAIRQYTGIPPKWVQFIYERYGIWTILNHPCGRYGFTVNGVWHPVTDYSDPVMRNAIQAEHACGWIYKGLVGRCSEPRGRLFLEAMVRFEASHAEELERLMKTTRDAMPDAEGVVVVMSKTPPLFQMPASVDYEQALRIAMEAEARASRYYDALSRLFGGAARELLRTLARHERAHEEAIRQSLGLAPQARGPLAMTG